MAYLSRLQYSPFWARAPKKYLPVHSLSHRSSQEYNNEFEKRSEDGLLGESGIPNAGDKLRRPWWHNGRVLVLVHAIFLVTYVAIATLILSGDINSRRHGLPFSPAVNALQWENHKFTLEDRIQDHGSFSGRPSAELDLAWHELLNAENIIIEPEYIMQLGRQDIGVAVPEGNGYLGTLNVYHEIHCLKRIHQFMYPDYYFPDLTEEEHEMNRLHNEHCIDFLRQSSMCHGDIGLITYEWRADNRLPVANATSHQCVNWEKLDQWTKARTVDMMKPGWLVHPILGVAYPYGEGDKIGAAQDSHHH